MPYTYKITAVPGATPDNYAGSYFGSTSQFNTNRDNLDDNSYTVNGILKGFDGRTSIGILSNWNRRKDGFRNKQALQQINLRFGLNFTDSRDALNYINQLLMNSSRLTGADMGSISVDGKWGDLSQRALDLVSSIYEKNGNTWDKVNQNNPYADKARTINSNPNTGQLGEVVVTAQKQPLQMFTKDDIRSLGFNNYLGLLNAVSNRNNWNNNFVKALNNRFGTDYANWKLEDIENALGVKGKYRSFGGGDFGDMSRSMASWMGTYNGNLEKKNLQDRTGSDGTVYSNKQVRDLFEAHPVKPKTFTFDTNSFEISKKQLGGQINMNEQQLQQAFLQYLMQKTGALNEQQLEQVVQQLGEDGLKQAYAQFVLEVQQLQVLAAKFGAKLNYIKLLNGQCPQGMEMHYFKQGGRLCKKCMQIEAQGGTVDKPVGDAIAQFKAAVGRNRKKFGKKYDEDQLAGRKPVGKDSLGRDLYLNGDGETIVKHSCGAKIKKDAMGNVIKKTGQTAVKIVNRTPITKNVSGYLSNRKNMDNLQKLLHFNRNHPYEDRSVDLTPAERATQDSLQNKARKDGSWQRGTGRK